MRGGVIHFDAHKALRAINQSINQSIRRD